ncbi:MAG: ribose 5-phosphate isomerase B [Chloroflexota bacterium]
MRIVIGGDHAGFPMKAPIVKALREWGHDVTDVGTHSADQVDFPDIADAVCERVRTGQADRGIMVCGTGVGAAIAANKFPGIRAALAHDAHSAHQCVEHDDVNVLCLGAKIVGEWLAIDLVRTFLDARFEDTEWYRRRIAKLAAIERRFGGGRG